jgi:hypothetical protein
LLQVRPYVDVPTVAGETLCVPLVANVPLQLPDAAQLVAFKDDQVSVVWFPAVTVVADEVSDGAPGGTSAMAASACTNPKPELTL